MSKKKKDKKRNKGTSGLVDRTKKRAAEHKSFELSSFDLPEGAQLFRVQSNKSIRLDILPYKTGEGNPHCDAGELYYERTFWVHRDIGAEGNSYICSRKTAGKKCPICDFRAKLTKDEDADEDLIKNLAPKERQLFNVIDTKNRDKGVQLFEISFHLFGKMLDARVKNADDDDGYEKFALLEDGLTLKCVFVEKHLGGNSFYEVETIDFKARKEDYEDDILDEVHCLDDLLKFKDYAELKAILLQTEDDDDSDDDDDDDDEKKSKKGKGKDKKDKKKKEPEPDDDDSDDEDDSDDDDDDADNDSDDDSDDDSDNDSDDDDDDNDDDDDSDDDDDDNDDDDDDDDWDDDDDSDDEDDDEKGKSEKKGKKVKSKSGDKKDKKKSSPKTSDKKKGKKGKSEKKGKKGKK